MKRKIVYGIITVLAAVACAQPAVAQDTVDNAEASRIAAKAARFFNNREWLNATAMYNLLLSHNPLDAGVQSHLTVARYLSGDHDGAVDQITRAMEADMPLDLLLDSVLTVSLQTGSPTMYRDLLEDMRCRVPWLSRRVDGLLLQYYNFRDNGPEIIRYAQIMLSGLPDNVEFLRLLARGYLLDNQPEAAAGVWARILRSHPDNRPTLLDLGMYYRLAGKADAARPLLARAYALEPTPYLQSLL